MESVSCKWLLLCFLYLSWAHSALALDELNGDVVKGVNLGGWLVLEGFITPSLFKGIPNQNMLDGTKVQFRSLSLNKYVSAQKGGDSGIVTVDIDKADTWETFRLWRLSETDFQFRTLNGQFLSCDGEGAPVLAKSFPPDSKETFSIENSDGDNVNIKNDDSVYIKHSSGKYLQVSGNELRADHEGIPTRDEYGATFQIKIIETMKGDYQLGAGYGLETAREVLRNHRSNFVTEADFRFLRKNGINTVRIPVGWWIAQDPNPPLPYVGGSLEYLNKAFEWAQQYGIKCIIDLHAAPGSQNGMEHSSSRDGTIDWTTSDNIQQTLRVINFLASKYFNHDALLGIELLNEPHAPDVSPDILNEYYKDGYDIVRSYSQKPYVIMCQRVGNGSKPKKLYKDIASMRLSKVVVDLHYYNLYIDLFFNKTPQQNIDYIYNERKSAIQSLNAGPLVFIGEWTNQFGKSNEGGYSSMDYQDYGRAQLDVYGSASFGWAYWTLKNVDDKHWNFDWNINNRTMKVT